MKKLIILITSILLLSSCQKSITVKITNTLAENRKGEMVELSLKTIKENLGLKEGRTFIIRNAANEEIPYQITYDQKVIFNATVAASSESTYTIAEGIPEKPVIKAYGAQYKKRKDDIAWENDLVGFRVYGPALQKKGDKAFGYDLFAKRNSDEPVLPSMYEMETDTEAWKQIKALRKTDFEASEVIRKRITYHVDHGYGMDCYAVGPTLGAGAAALEQNGEIIYPWCYKAYEILDNGPLRFTVKLEFTPATVGDQDNIIETRIITLDAGSHFNKTSVHYENLQQESRIVAGIALHDDGEIIRNQEKRFIAYVDPTLGPDQGKLYIGNVFSDDLESTEIRYFIKNEEETYGMALGHVLGISTYHPGSEFTYWWGFGWNRGDIPSFDAWKEHIGQFSDRLSHPLEITIQ